MPTSKTIAKRVEARKAQAAKQALQKASPSPGTKIWVSNGATLKCSLGTAPSKLVVEASATYDRSEGQWLATIMQHKPNKNIKPFGSCKRSFPPPPCGPSTPPQWTAVEPTRLAGPNSFPVLAYPGATLKCSHGGTITIINPGQTKKKVDAAKPKTRRQTQRARANAHRGSGQGVQNLEIKDGCIRGNFGQETAHFPGGTVKGEFGAFEACATPQKISAEITGLKATVANTANTSKATLSVGKLSVGASPGGINMPSASLVEASLSQTMSNGVTAEVSAGLGKLPSFGLK